MQVKNSVTNEEISKIVKVFLRTSGISQASLAGVLDMHQSTISRVSSGNFTRRSDNVNRIYDHALMHTKEDDNSNELETAINRFLRIGGDSRLLIKLINTLSDSIQHR